MTNADDLIQELNDRQIRINYEVLPRGYGLFGWKLCLVGGRGYCETIATFKHKDEAVAYARDYMWDMYRQHNEHTELVIKNRWGKIVEKNTYPRWSDPRETKG